MKIAVTDIETTGLDADVNEILEIGLVVFDDTNFEILDTFEIKVKPEHPEIHHPKAFEMNGYNEADWKDAVPLSVAMQTYQQKIDGTIFCAHNMNLDYSFIKKAFVRCGIEIERMFDRHQIDLFTVAWAKIPHDRMEKWHLPYICRYLGVPEEPKPHRGKNGATTAYEVYKKLMQ